MAFSPNQTLKHVFTDQFPCFLCIFARCKLMLNSKLHEVLLTLSWFSCSLCFCLNLTQNARWLIQMGESYEIIFFSHWIFFTRFALRAHVLFVKRTFSFSIATRKWLITRDLYVFAIIEFVDAFTPCIMVAISLSWDY